MIPPFHLLHYTCGPRVVDPSNEPSPWTTMAFPVGNALPKARPTYGFRARSLLPVGPMVIGYSSVAFLGTTS